MLTKKEETVGDEILCPYGTEERKFHFITIMKLAMQ